MLIHVPSSFGGSGFVITTVSSLLIIYIVQKDVTHASLVLTGFLYPVFLYVPANIATLRFITSNVFPRCNDQRNECDACSERSAHEMQTYRGSHRCNITSESSDNGESPRLQYCFSCRCEEMCARDCEVYSKAECAQIRWGIQGYGGTEQLLS